MIPLLLTLALSGGAACTGPSPGPSAGGATLVYTGNVDGEIEPCG